MAQERVRPEIRNVRPAPQADTEPLGTLTVEPAFDPALVGFVDGSGSMSPNPVGEDGNVSFQITVRNDNDKAVVVDVSFRDTQTGTTWADVIGVTVSPNDTEPVGAISPTPIDLGIAPGDYTMEGSMPDPSIAAMRRALDGGVGGTTGGIDNGTWAVGLTGVGALATAAWLN